MMDSDTKDLYFQSIDEYVLDENKIVTCRWLSRILNLEPIATTELLTSWIQHRREKYPDTKLFATHLIAGVKKDGKGAVLTIVRESHVDIFLETLNPGAAQHIYSIEKGTSIPDINIIGTVENNFIPSLGTITCPEVFKKFTYKPKTITDAVEISSKQLPAVKLEVSNASESKTKNTFFKNSSKPNVNSNDNNSSEKKDVEKVTPPNGKKCENNKTKNKPKGGIANFFNRPASKTTTSANTKSSKTQHKSPPVAVKVKNDFFAVKTRSDKNGTKPNGIDKISPPKIELKKEDDIKEVIREFQSKRIDTEDTEVKLKVEVDYDSDVIENSPNVQKDVPKKRKRPNKNKKVKKEGVEVNKNAKKRKRIMAPRDSSDDDIFGSDHEDKPAGTPEKKPQDMVNSPKEQSPLQPLHKNVRKKYIDRTYTDEDGFIMTRKELIECSASEDEAPPAPKVVKHTTKSAAPTSRKKPIATNSKQSNLFSFFQKK